MNSTRLKFELIEPQTAPRTANPLAHLASRLRREEAPSKHQPRADLLHDLAQGLEFLIAQLHTAESDRDQARAEAERFQAETAKLRDEIAGLQREVATTTAGAAGLRSTRQNLEAVLAEQQRALLLSMELMHRFETEIVELRGRVEAMEATPAPPAPAPPDAALPATPPPELQQEIEELRATLERYESEKRSTEAQRTSLESRIESLLAEGQQQVAAIHSLESELRELRATTDAERADWERREKQAAEVAAEKLAASGKEAEDRTRQISRLEEQCKTVLEENARLREDLAELQKLGDPSAAIRELEQQRDAARAEAASARADVAIQSAEIETKDALIGALERALEQQHGSLRSLEQRFAEYATKLQELRLDRLSMPSSGGGTADEGSSGIRRLFRGFRRTFSPSEKPVIAPTEEA